MLNLINNERAGKLGGKTVQLVPHLTNAIQNAIIDASTESDVHIVEIGGTVGDYEGLSYIEAIREFSQRVGREKCMYIHVVYVPYIGTSKEFKTKPAQNAMQDLRGFGIFPDAVVVRTEEPAPTSVSRKISLLSGIPEEYIVDMPNVDTVYRIPEKMAQSPLHELLSKFTGVKKKPDLNKWNKLIENRIKRRRQQYGLAWWQNTWTTKTRISQ